jgi:hypothetical protein
LVQLTSWLSASWNQKRAEKYKIIVKKSLGGYGCAGAALGKLNAIQAIRPTIFNIAGQLCHS